MLILLLVLTEEIKVLFLVLVPSNIVNSCRKTSLVTISREQIIRIIEQTKPQLTAES